MKTKQNTKMMTQKSYNIKKKKTNSMEFME